MKSNDDSSSIISGSSAIDSLASGSGSTSDSSTFNFVNFKKPPRNIVITKDTLNNQKLVKQKRKQEISENERDQQRLDLDVILSGFPVKPNVSGVVGKFLRLLNTPMSVVKSFHHFENKINQHSAEPTTFHHVIITFKEKSQKVKVLAAKSSLKGPLRWNQLIEIKENVEEYQNNPIISCQNRFSKFNVAVEKQLRRLTSNGIVAAYQFGNIFYQYKQTPLSEWKVISVTDDLNYLNDLIKYKSIVVASQR